MAKDSQSYELISRGVDTAEENERAYTSIDDTEPPVLETKMPATKEKLRTTSALSRPPSSVFLDTNASVEESNVPLETRLKPFLLSLVVHILPSATTIGIIQLTFRNVFWFDNDPNSDKVHWKSLNISLNELLNGLQFIAKIHEILLVGSLGAMVMHRVRNRLLGKRGLPFGMMTAGYSVGSAEYLLNPAFWSGFNKKFMTLSLLIMSFTILANTFGPASAIALVPSLDWWPIKHPFGDKVMPVYFEFDDDHWWPMEITKNDTRLDPNDLETYPASLCFSTEGVDFDGCPAGGYDDLAAWTVSNANDAAQATISMSDGVSNAQRIVTSSLTKPGDDNSSVAFATSASQSITSLIGAFWEQARAGQYFDDVIRPKLEISERDVRQPLVQVQCSAFTIDYIRNQTTRNGKVKSNNAINTFSTTNVSDAPVPDWLYEYEYEVPKKLFIDDLGRVSIRKSQTTNLTWLQLAEGSNLSAVGVVIVPFAYQDDNDEWAQTAIAHICSVDARWVGSQHGYDPTVDIRVADNITDPLVFQKPKDGTEEAYKNDIRNLGVSPALNLSIDWMEAMNINVERGNLSARAMNWLLTPYILVQAPGPENATFQQLNETGSQAVYFTFVPGKANLLDSSTGTVVSTVFHTHVSNTIATLLSLQITDALARLRSFSVSSGFLASPINATHSNAISLTQFAGFSEGKNISTGALSHVKNRWIFSVQRYGYGFGFRSTTVYFGIIVLLAHLGLVAIYLCYAFYDFFYRTRWTSSAWGSMAEFAALLVNSKPTVELQNTCAGVDAKETWRKDVWIKEVDDGHLAVVVGQKEGSLWRNARKGVPYGTLKETGRRRRESI